MLPPKYLDELFADFPPGQALLAQIRDFYGPSLCVNRHDEADGISHFALETGGPSLKFGGAIIDLNTTTGRVKAAAMHELLHLRQPIHRFPTINGMTVTPGNQTMIYTDDIPSLESVLGATNNIVQHDIFVGEFVASGLLLSDFLGQRSKIPQYSAEARQCQGKALNPHQAWIWAFRKLIGCNAAPSL